MVLVFLGNSIVATSTSIIEIYTMLLFSTHACVIPSIHNLYIPFSHYVYTRTGKLGGSAIAVILTKARDRCPSVACAVADALIYWSNTLSIQVKLVITSHD